MDGLGYACGVALAVVFVRAGTAKLARPDETATSFAALGVPSAGHAACAVPVVELLLAVTLLAAPSGGAMGALALLVPFTAVLARAVRAGSRVPCNCFGAASGDPVSWADVARNLLLIGLALAAVTAGGPSWPEAGSVAVAGAACASGWALVVALRRGLVR